MRRRCIELISFCKRSPSEIHVDIIVVIYLLEVVCDLKLTLLTSNVRLHLGVGVVDNGEEHVEKHEEYKEHVGDEEHWTQDAVGVLDLVEVKVSEDDAEQGETVRIRQCIKISCGLTCTVL